MPNSPSVQPLVGAELDHRARDQREALAARVLEQVGAELVDDLVLDALVALAVLRRQPDRVLVGHVGARDRHGLVLVHLARELARELDRAHLGAEGAPEGALDEAGDLLSRLRRTLMATGTPRRGVSRSCYAAPLARDARMSTASTPASVAPSTAAPDVGRQRLRAGGQRGAPDGGADEVRAERPAAHEQRQRERRERPHAGHGEDQPVADDRAARPRATRGSGRRPRRRGRARARAPRAPPTSPARRARRGATGAPPGRRRPATRRRRR